MNEDNLTSIIDSITEKVGADVAATIADDFGNLITKNDEALKGIAERDKKIEELQSRNDKLVMANGSLLQQIGMGEDTGRQRKNPDPEQKREIKLADCFDKRGGFVK